MTFNCSMDIPDARLDYTIVWTKNGQDLEKHKLDAINDLQTITDGVTSLLSTVRYRSGVLPRFATPKGVQTVTGVLVLRRIKNVQRSDAGEYRCRLSVSQMVVESQPITVKVEGEIQPCDGFLFFLSISFLTQLWLMRRSASIRPPAGGQECNKRLSLHSVMRGGWTPRPGSDPLAPGWVIR